jgi:hypothetical protein
MSPLAVPANIFNTESMFGWILEFSYFLLKLLSTKFFAQAFIHKVFCSSFYPQSFLLKLLSTKFFAQAFCFKKLEGIFSP